MSAKSNIVAASEARRLDIRKSLTVHVCLALMSVIPVRM